MPPDDFSNHLARWVYERNSSSVVYLELHPNPLLVLPRWITVHPLAAGTAGLVERANRRNDCRKVKCGTGFFVEAAIPDDDGHFVLTTAHMLAPVFNADNPITAEQVAQMYEPRLLCGHREQAHLELEGPRPMISGMVHSISCENDLMLIRFAPDDMQHYCPHLHRPLSFADEFPSSLKEMVMIAFPKIGRHWVTAIGTSSQENRKIADMYGHKPDSNPFGFTARFSEVDITSEGGCSGAPLMNGLGHVTGVLHGNNKSFTFFVGLAELRNTLIAWGVIAV